MNFLLISCCGFHLLASGEHKFKLFLNHLGVRACRNSHDSFNNYLHTEHFIAVSILKCRFHRCKYDICEEDEEPEAPDGDVGEEEVLTE